KKKMQHRQEKNFAASIVAGEPAVKHGAEHRSKTRRQQNNGGLPKRKLPRPGNERDDVADQEVVEELEHVAQNRGGNDPALIARQPCLLLEVLEHVEVCSGGSYTTASVDRQSLVPKSPEGRRIVAHPNSAGWEYVHIKTRKPRQERHM